MSKCKAIMEFGDDFGDNTCTFHCELEEGHEGLHQETGKMSGEQFPYTVTWDRDMRLDGRPLCPQCKSHEVRWASTRKNEEWYRCRKCNHDFVVKE